MASSALSWSALRPLRPILIAGAAAVAWLSFAAPSAEASPQQNQDSLLGGIASTVSSTLDSEAHTAGVPPTVQKTIHSLTAQPARHPSAVTVPAPVPAPIPQPQQDPASSAPTAAPHALPPLVKDLAAAPLEAAVNTLPSANVVPTGAATQLTAPVTALADKAVGGIAETVTGSVVRPVADAAPALEAPLESITDVLAETPPLAAPALAPIVEVVENLATPHVSDVVLPLPAPLAAVTGSASSDSADSVRVSNGPSQVLVPAPDGIPGLRLSPHSAVLPSLVPTRASQSSPGMSAGGGLPTEGEVDPPGAPHPTPPAGSGAGNGQSPGGPSPSAAWLTNPFDYLPLMGLVPASGPLQHLPSPVAIDPGSSPD